MVRYEAKWTGPVSFDWYQARGLTQSIPCKNKSGWMAAMIRSRKGPEFEVEEIAEYYAGGVVNVSGSLEQSLSVPIMDQVSWNEFSKWLSRLKTESVFDIDTLLTQFQSETGRVIRWADALGAEE